MEEVAASGETAVVTQDVAVSLPLKKVKKKPEYHRCKLFVFRFGGHFFAVGFMTVAAAAIFFPGAKELLYQGFDSGLVLAVSSLTVVARFSLGYRGLMFPVIERAVKSAAKIRAADETDETRKKRVALRKKNAVKISVLIVISTPFVSLFSLATLYSIEKFQAQVANQTVTNATLFLDVFFQNVANATESPAVQGVLVGCTGAFNLLANVQVLTAPFAILIVRKREYIAILLTDGWERALRRYRMGVDSGTVFWLGLGTLGNVVYFPFSALMFKYFWHAPEPVGYLLGLLVFTNLMLLAYIILEPLIKAIMEEGVDWRRGKHTWPSVPQIALNILTAGSAGIIVTCGAVFAVFVADESHANAFFVAISAVLLGLLEWPSVYYLLKLPEFGIRTLLGRPSAEQLALRKQAQEAEEAEWSDEEVQSTDSDSINGDLKRSSSMESPVGELGGEWEDSGRSITPPPKVLKGSAEDFSTRQGTPPESSEESSSEKKTTVGWKEWAKQTFFWCCDGSRGKGDKVTNQVFAPVAKQDSKTGLIHREAGQNTQRQVGSSVSGVALGYQG